MYNIVHTAINKAFWIWINRYCNRYQINFYFNNFLFKVVGNKKCTLVKLENWTVKCLHYFLGILHPGNYKSISSFVSTNGQVMVGCFPALRCCGVQWSCATGSFHLRRLWNLRLPRHVSPRATVRLLEVCLSSGSTPGWRQLNLPRSWGTGSRR